MSPSVSPSEFLATHRYEPKSPGPTLRIFSFINLLYPVFDEDVSYLSPARDASGFFMKEKETNVVVNIHICA